MVSVLNWLLGLPRWFSIILTYSIGSDRLSLLKQISLPSQTLCYHFSNSGNISNWHCLVLFCSSPISFRAKIFGKCADLYNVSTEKSCLCLSLINYLIFKDGDPEFKVSWVTCWDFLMLAGGRQASEFCFSVCEASVIVTTLCCLLQMSSCFGAMQGIASICHHVHIESFWIIFIVLKVV